MATSESKGRFFCKTNRFESIRITNRIDSNRELECSERADSARIAVTAVAIYGSAYWEGCLKAFAVSVSAVSHLKTIQSFGVFIMFLGRLTTALLQFIVSVVVISVRPSPPPPLAIIYSTQLSLASFRDRLIEYQLRLG